MFWLASLIFQLGIFIILGCLRRGVFDLYAIAHHIALIKWIKILEIAGFFSRRNSEGLFADLIIIFFAAVNIRSQVIAVVVVGVVRHCSDRVVYCVVVSLILLFRGGTLVKTGVELLWGWIIQRIHIQSLRTPYGIWIHVCWRRCERNEIILVWWIRHAVLSTHRVAGINQLIVMVNYVTVIMRWIRNLGNKCLWRRDYLGRIILP